MSDYEQDIERYCDGLRTEIAHLQETLQVFKRHCEALTAEINDLREAERDIERLRAELGRHEQEIEILRDGLLAIAGARNKYVGDAGAFIESLQATARFVLGSDK